MCGDEHSARLKSPLFRTSLVGCACWLCLLAAQSCSAKSPAHASCMGVRGIAAYPALPKVQPIHPVWAFAAPPLTLLRSRVQGSPVRAYFAPSFVKEGEPRSGERATRDGCPGLSGEDGMRSLKGGGFSKFPSFRTSRPCYVRKSRATIHGRPLSASRFAPLFQRGKTRKAGPVVLQECGCANLRSFATGVSALAAQGDLSRMFIL